MPLATPTQPARCAPTPRRRGTADAVITYLRGRVALAAGRTDNALKLFEDACATDPGLTPARVALAKLYLEAYRFDRALQIAGRSQEDRPEDARLERVLGDIHRRLDNFEKAKLHYRAALQLDRGDADTMFALAQVLHADGEANRAQFQLRAMLDEHPEHDQAREMLAFTYLEEGRADLAIEQLQKLRKDSPSPGARARAEAWLARLQQPDPEAFRRVLLESAREHPDADTWLAIAGSYDEFEQQQAKEAFLQVLELDPDSEDALVGLLRAEKRLLDFESAIERLEVLIHRRPNRHAWRLDLVELRMIVLDHAGALELAREEEARDGLDETIRLAYRLRIIRALDRMGQGDQAIAQLEAWARQDPSDRRIAALLGERYIRTDHADKAVGVFETLYQKDRDDRSTMLQLATALSADGRHDHAAQLVLEWLAEDPANDQLQSDLVLVLAEADRPDDALELIQNRLLATHAREYFQNLAMAILVDAGRHEESLDLIEQLVDEVMSRLRTASLPAEDRAREPYDRDRLALQPDEPHTLDTLSSRLVELRLRLARQLLVMESYREAETSLNEWLDTVQDRGSQYDILTLLSLCQTLQGRDEKAAETLERAWLLQIDEPGLNNDLAYTWIDRGQRLDEAERMIRYALSRAPSQAAYLDTYGWLLYKKGDFAGARKWLDRAVVANDGDDPALLDHLGDACWRLGLAEEAVTQWRKAVAAATGRQEQADTTLSHDERRILQEAPQKIDAAQAGGTPHTAPLAPDSTG